MLCENRISRQFAISTAHPLSSNDPNDAAFRLGNKSQKVAQRTISFRIIIEQRNTLTIVDLTDYSLDALVSMLTYFSMQGRKNRGAGGQAPPPQYPFSGSKVPFSCVRNVMKSAFFFLKSAPLGLTTPTFRMFLRPC